jgi:murein DD-endopeptidase MepM/ murein hydrolase activator NlpD
VTSTFGPRKSPFGGGSDFHKGLDLSAPIGTLIYAPADGVVLSSDWSVNGYGQLLTIDHGFGLSTRYAHLSESLVAPGETVTRGQPVARVGNTGRSTGPHLHYETILGGVAVDPLFFVPAARNPLKEASAAEGSRKKGIARGQGLAKEPS